MLAARHVDDAEPEQQVTAAEWLAAHRAGVPSSMMRQVLQGRGTSPVGCAGPGPGREVGSGGRGTWHSSRGGCAPGSAARGDARRSARRAGALVMNPAPSRCI